jgi:hypothetical protein
MLATPIMWAEIPSQIIAASVGCNISRASLGRDFSRGKAGENGRNKRRNPLAFKSFPSWVGQSVAGMLLRSACQIAREGAEEMLLLLMYVVSSDLRGIAVRSC